MAPTKGSAKGSKAKPSSKAGGASKKQVKKSAGSAPTGISKRKAKGLSLAKPGGAQKTKSRLTDGKKKRRTYTEAELDIPKLNSIVPAGIAKPKGQKKGKKFVDDAESMMAIMSVVNAEKEGAVESKIMRARQLEEIREAKRKEAEKRSDVKKAAFEDKKDSLRKKRKSRHSEPARIEDVENEDPKSGKDKKGKKERKRVSFG
jgi:60S ribosomal subunit assembly/export protein LOC1